MRTGVSDTVCVPLSKGVLSCNEELCAGCMNCMFACTLNKDSAACLDLARIQMNTYTQAVFHIEALPCLQCVDPQCMRFCPVHAISIDEITGARVVNEEKCIGCKTCISACPYEVPRIVFDTVKKKATKCDLCGGDPECVKMCPTGALKYITDPAGIKTGFELEEEA
ncbi:MAG: 4Fe-4S dicluster domain-containing protein [Blautia sp.]|nr:4Fe-4S dicluster domain-containing protein [Blautia sp.]